MTPIEKAQGVIEGLRNTPEVLLALRGILRDMKILEPWKEEVDLSTGRLWWSRGTLPVAWVSQTEDGEWEWQTMAVTSQWAYQATTPESARDECDRHLRALGWLLVDAMGVTP